jgi:hypothetical protein
MRVRATQLGYYEVSLIEAGKEFTIRPEQFSGNWMEVIAADTQEHAGAEQSALASGADPEPPRRKRGRPRKVI